LKYCPFLFSDCRAILYKNWNCFLSGREYDQNGNLHQWWNNETIEKFKDRTECVVDQYTKYEINNKHLNGRQTLGMIKLGNTTFYWRCAGWHVNLYIVMLSCISSVWFFVLFYCYLCTCMRTLNKSQSLCS
jgi:hypothetical protein